MPNYTDTKVGSHDLANPSLPLLARVVEYAYTDLDASNKLYIPIDADTLVLGVGHLIVTQFAGGTPNVDIGDADDADGYANDLNPAAAAGTWYNSMAATIAFTAGKYYGTPGRVTLTHATGLTAGAGKVFIFVLPLAKSWREASLI